MKVIIERPLLIFIITVVAIMAKPCFVFASPAFRSAVTHYSNAFDSRKMVRKRNDSHTQDEPAEMDDTRRRTMRVAFHSFFTLLKRIQFNLLLLRSSFISFSTLLFSKHATVFQISPHNDQYLSLLVFRI